MGKDSSPNDSADFATILAFFQKFGDQCGIVERPDSKKLQQMLENSDDGKFSTTSFALSQFFFS
jgi:hypothetical protein